MVKVVWYELYADVICEDGLEINTYYIALACDRLLYPPSTRNGPRLAQHRPRRDPLRTSPASLCSQIDIGKASTHRFLETLLLRINPA